ncbi:MAG TPA: cation diffusion facilitator family transporter [Saprospiraceae bacterium]|nr:cation diffusion facilitator family transporter [Saprospiraceae bacterium]
MSHDHDHHSHAHSHSLNFEESNRRAFVIGIYLNMAFVIAEIIGGLIFHSISLLTDAGHNLSDVASLFLSLLAFKMATKKSSPVYTYGFKKTTVLAALANAVILFIAIGILGVESFTRLLKPEKVQGSVIAWIAAMGIVINTVTAFLFYRHRKKELNARSAYLHLFADALISLGVVVTGIIIVYTGWYWLDAVTGIIIMIIILISAWGLLRDSFKMTIDAVPAGIELEEIKKIILQVDHVKQVGHVHVWPLSTTENALTAHVVIDEELSFDEKLKVVAAIRHELIHHNIHHSTIELQKSVE